MRNVLCAMIATALTTALAACGEDEPRKTTVQPAAVQPAIPAPEAKAAPVQVAAPESTPPPRIDPNAELARKVKSALHATPGLEALAVDIVAADGTVTLFGTADSPDSVQRAAKVAAGVAGVKSVQNKMVVVRGS